LNFLGLNSRSWKELKLKMHLGLDSVGSSYSELVSKVGSSVGVADGEPGAMRFCEVLKIQVLNHIFRGAIAVK
jgi:hypothetical protein